MSTIGALNQGLAGIQRGFDGLRRDANQIARANGPDRIDADVARSLVSLSADRAQVEASLKVIEAAGEMVDTIGRLLDVKA